MTQTLVIVGVVVFLIGLLIAGSATAWPRHRDANGGEITRSATTTWQQVVDRIVKYMIKLFEILLGRSGTRRKMTVLGVITMILGVAIAIGGIAIGFKDAGTDDGGDKPPSQGPSPTAEPS